MSRLVGMSRDINLDYLNKTIEVMNEVDDLEIVKSELKDYISLHIDAKINVRKTVSILMNIWFLDSEKDRRIKEYARELVAKGRPETRLVANWCMMLVTYGVFKDIANTIGKLEKMQLELTSRLVREKMLDLWGERTTLIHAIPKNIKTMRDIGVLESPGTGKYEVRKKDLKDPEAITLLVATLIFLKDKLYLSMEELNDNEMMFPFKYHIDIGMLQESGMFSFDRFGGEMVISLAE